MTADTKPRPDDGTPIVRLWVVNLAPPMLVLLDLQFAYMLVDHECRRGSSLSGHLVHGVMVALVLVTGLIAWRSWREFGREDPGEEADLRSRSRFMSVLGVLISALSLLTIVAQWMAAFFLSPCQ
jgi:hypothetical protein